MPLLSPVFKAFCVSALLFPLAVQADPNWDAAKEGLAICAKTYPHGSKAREALKAAGWRSHGVEAGMYIYSQNGYRAIAATNAGTSSSPRCFVSASKMPPAFANEVAKPLVSALKGAKEMPPRPGVKRWSGSFNGNKTIVGVLDNVEFGLMRGAAVGFIGD